MPIGKGNTHAPTSQPQQVDSPPRPTPQPYDSLTFIMAFEGGELDDSEIIEGFQHLIDSGLAWSLQGSYGRTAMALVEAGYCHL